MTDHIKFGTKAWQDRMDRWAHYGLIGSCRWIETKMNIIIAAPTASPNAKGIALKILGLAAELKMELAKEIVVK